MFVTQNRLESVLFEDAYMMSCLVSESRKLFSIILLHLFNLDELIRQVTINCAERGLLLLRVRDEIHLSILSYQTLLESAIGYGVRKAVLFEQQQSQALIERDLEKVKNAELNRTVGFKRNA
jgi:hypothetical protein